MYYAVFRGRTIGIYESWGECRAQVLGFSNALFKKFVAHEDAVKYMEEGPWPNAPKIQAVKFSQ